MSTSRFLLPQGFSAFRSDLGDRIRDKRRDDFRNQQALADAIGISRPSLSRIERGHAWPLPDTLDALMRLLELDWKDVAEKEIAGKGAPGVVRRRLFDGTSRHDHLLEMCRAVRTGRKVRGLKVAQAAVLAELSTSQLSRLERGQCQRSRVLVEREEDRHLPPERRRLRFKNDYLQGLAAEGKK